MNIQDPFLTPQMRVTLAKQLNFVACERGCLDDDGIPMGDWHLLLLFLEKFAGGADIAQSLRRLKESLSAISLVDTANTETTMADLKGPQAFEALLGDAIKKAVPFSYPMGLHDE